MDNYESRKRRQHLIRSSVLAGGVAAGYLGRKQLASGLLRASSWALERWGQTDVRNASFAIARATQKMRWLTEGEGLEHLAIEQVASHRMRQSLIAEAGWGRSAAEELFRTREAQRHWTSAVLTGGAGTLRGQSYAGLRGHLPGKSIDDIFSDIRSARQSASVTGLYQIAREDGMRVPFAADPLGGVLRRQLESARAHVERAYLQGLADQSAIARSRDAVRGQASWLEAIARKAGAERVTFGELDGAAGILDRRGLRRLQDAREYIEDIASRHRDIGLDVSRVPIEGLWRDASGRITDLRGMPGMLGRALESARGHFQVPIIPYARGFSPATLFPWLTGEARGGVHVLSHKNIGKQLGIADLVGGRELNVALVGKRAIGFGFGENAAGAEILGNNIVALDARGGFHKRVLENMYVAQQAGSTPGIRGWLGKQEDPSKLSALRSVWGKYFDKDSEYPAEVLRRLFLPESDPLRRQVTSAPDYISSLASFLKTEGSMDSRTFRQILNLGHISDSELTHAFVNIGSDDAVLRFFENKATDRTFMPASSRLESLLREFESSEGSVAWRHHPRRSRGIINASFLGEEDYRTGLDLMRSALMEEYILSYPASVGGNNLFQHVSGLAGLSEETRQQALSFIQGSLLENAIRQEGFESAVSAFTRVRGLRENAQWMVDKHLSVLDAYNPLANTHDLPSTFLIRGHESIVGAINREISSGNDAINAVINAVSGTAGGQYWKSWFTGMKDPKNFTRSSLVGYFFEERLNRMLAETGLGLGPQDLGSAASILFGLAAKRALPLWLGYEAYNYYTYEADKLGLPSPEKLWANVKANTGLVRARLMGSHAHHLGAMLPGLEKYVEFNTYDEEKEQLRSGYEAVRSGRYWLFGSRGEFMGGKVRYWLPHSFQRAYSRWETAENADISSDAYWAHSILPTPRFPLSPIMHFANPYWWEKRHSVGDNPDRPYVKSGPAFTPETPWGPVLNATLGNILKPQIALHPDYDPRSIAAARALKGAGRAVAGAGYTGLGGNLDTAANLGADTLLSLIEGGDFDIADAAYSANAEDDARDAAVFSLHRGSFARVRTAGGVSLVGPGGRGRGSARRQLKELNAALKAEGSHTTSLRTADGRSANIVGYSGNAGDVQYPSFVEQMRDSAREHAGLYGWLAEMAGGGEPPTGLRMADASHAYGLSTRFWTMGLGGLGGELSEIGRRFLRKRPGTVEWYNPVPNAFWGSWLPGDDSYINLERGDPYGKIPHGEMRLPGEAYEMLHGVKLMQSRASSLGKTPEEIALEMLHMKEPLDEEGERVTELGNAIHKAVQKKWREQGVLKSAETLIYDDRLGVSAHIDALLEMYGQRYIGEIKSMSDKRFRTIFPHSEHLDQLNFYLHATGIKKGILVYVNRDNPEQVKLYHTYYNPFRQWMVEKRLAKARHIVEGMVESGQVPRAQLYDDATRFEILADVAPYSREYQALAASLSGDDQISEAQHARIVAAKKRAQAQKKNVDLHSYHFAAGNELDFKLGMVNQVLDANTIQMVGGEIVRLAGVRASNQRIDDYVSEHGYTTREKIRRHIAKAVRRTVKGALADTYLISDEKALGLAQGLTNWLIGDDTPAESFYKRFGIRRGAIIGLRYSEDDEERYGQDMFHSLRAVVSTLGTENVNNALLRMGIAVERENDFSAAGVEARFNGLEQKKGALWERFSHLDTPWHTKFLRVRSPYEEYVRGHVYGSNQGNWNHPFRSYIWPTIDAYIARNPVMAGLSMGLFASMFTPTKSMKWKVGKYGAAIGASLSIIRKGYELISGKPWIPPHVQTQRDIEEYWDKINYLKYKNLYEFAAQQARKREHTDVEKIIEREEKAGFERKRIQRALSSQKARLKLKGAKRGDEQLAKLNARAKKIAEYEKDLKLGRWGTQALLYRDRYMSTMYGFDTDSGDYKGMMRALPKYEREIVAGMMKDSTPSEKKKFYRLLPDYEKRILARALGQGNGPDREDLDDYFRHHTLPGAGWEGWDPQVDNNMLKARAVVAEGLDPMEFGLYPQQIAQAEAITQEIEVPTVHGRSTHITESLRNMLTGRGLRNAKVMVQMVPDPNANQDTVDIRMELSHDRHRDLISALRLR